MGRSGPSVGREIAYVRQGSGMDSLGEAEAKFLRAKLQAFLSRNPEADIKAGGRELSVSGALGRGSHRNPSAQ